MRGILIWLALYARRVVTGKKSDKRRVPGWILLSALWFISKTTNETGTKAGLGQYTFAAPPDDFHRQTPSESVKPGCTATMFIATVGAVQQKSLRRAAHLFAYRYSM